MTSRAALLLLGAFVLAACGGSEGAETGGGAPGTTAAPAPKISATVADGWTATAIGEGIKPALALDSAGAPAVAYLREDIEHGSVSFASQADGWKPETVAEGYFYGPLDLAFDPQGRPNIVYHDHESTEVDPRKGNLVYAVRDPSGWTAEAARNNGHDGWDSAIAIASDGVVRAAGVDPAQFGSEEGVEYYELGDGGWTVVSIGSGPVVYEFNVSLAVDPDGRPALTYYDDRAGDLVFASFDGRRWNLERAVSKGDAGKFSSLAFDARGRPHVSFLQQQSPRSGAVRYAVRDGKKWVVEDVGTLGDIVLGMTGARRNTSLALDAVGVPHIAFSDRSGLRYAVRSQSGWDVQDVVTAGERPLGQLVDLALDETGTPHLAFYEVAGESPLEGLVAHLRG